MKLSPNSSVTQLPLLHSTRSQIDIDGLGVGVKDSVSNFTSQNNPVQPRKQLHVTISLSRLIHWPLLQSMSSQREMLAVGDGDTEGSKEEDAVTGNGIEGEREEKEMLTLRNIDSCVENGIVKLSELSTNNNVVVVSSMSAVESLSPAVVKEDGFGRNIDDMAITELDVGDKEKDFT